MNMSSDSAGSVADINIAFLRGINVGGRNRLPMRDLTAMFVDAGCSNVRTTFRAGTFCTQPGRHWEMTYPRPSVRRF